VARDPGDFIHDPESLRAKPQYVDVPCITNREACRESGADVVEELCFGAQASRNACTAHEGFHQHGDPRDEGELSRVARRFGMGDISMYDGAFRALARAGSERALHIDTERPGATDGYAWDFLYLAREHDGRYPSRSGVACSGFGEPRLKRAQLRIVRPQELNELFNNWKRVVHYNVCIARRLYETRFTRIECGGAQQGQ
jgi:hypothetical protein